ncbi:MAG: hypothetical protein Q8L37_06890 [Candidatus Gottesmanbacteria bacterium]|nr:hypothetical protein [Candidatus Gottesmanbacteria bacterium]
MRNVHTVIIIPGLGDETRVLGYITWHWKSYGLEPVVYSVGWRDGEESFRLKLNRLVKLIDEFVKKGAMVSLVGTSAGGSAALNAFTERKNKIHRVINVCGRLRVGPTTGLRSFASKTKSSPAFAQSVRLCEQSIKRLAVADRKKIMTVHAMFGDELVPSETTIIEGANNIQVPTAEHIVSIGAALTVFSKSLISFLIIRKF